MERANYVLSLDRICLGFSPEDPSAVGLVYMTTPEHSRGETCSVFVSNCCHPSPEGKLRVFTAHSSHIATF